MSGDIRKYCPTCKKDTYWIPIKYQDTWLRKRKAHVCEGCGARSPRRLLKVGVGRSEP